MTDIHIATPADIDRIMPVLMRLHGENGFVSADNEKILIDVWAGLHQDAGVIGYIESDDKTIEGVVVLRVGKMWYSSDDVLEEKLVYVPPEYRNAKGGRARRLVEFSKSMADRMGLPLLIGVLSNERTKGKSRLYQRMFGPPAGEFFLYNASTSNSVAQEA